MSTYSLAIALHVVISVLGVGSVAAIPITAGGARRANIPLSASSKIVRALFGVTRWSLLVVLVSGVVLDFAVHGAFHDANWFRLSFLLVIFVGVSNGLATRGLQRDVASGKGADETLQTVQRWGWVMSSTVAVIVVLMVWKPVL